MLMAKPIFLEIVIRVFLEPSHGWLIKDQLDEALKAAGLGLVTGGGGGGGSCNVDVEVTDVPGALAIIRRVFEELREGAWMRNVVVNQYQPEEIVHRLEE
jgi:hypothetical protein